MTQHDYRFEDYAPDDDAGDRKPAPDTIAAEVLEAKTMLNDLENDLIELFNTKKISFAIYDKLLSYPSRVHAVLNEIEFKAELYEPPDDEQADLADLNERVTGSAPSESALLMRATEKEPPPNPEQPCTNCGGTGTYTLHWPDKQDEQIPCWCCTAGMVNPILTEG